VPLVLLFSETFPWVAHGLFQTRETATLWAPIDFARTIDFDFLAGGKRLAGVYVLFAVPRTISDTETRPFNAWLQLNKCTVMRLML